MTRIALAIFLCALGVVVWGAGLPTRTVEPLDVFEIVSLRDEGRNEVVVDHAGVAVWPVFGRALIAGVAVEDVCSQMAALYDAKEPGRAPFEVKLIGTRRTAVRFRGAVTHSGSLPFLPNLRLADVVAVAVPTVGADLDAIRIESGDGSSRLVAFTDLGAGNPKLAPGDTVHFEIDPQPREILVLGEVLAPGVLDFVVGLTLRKALAMAGGTTGSAELTKVEILRNGRLWKEIDLTVAADLELQRGDVIRVPAQKVRRTVSVVGYVVRPGPVAFVEGMRLTQALELAGGIVAGERQVEMVLVRPHPGGQPTRTRLKLEDIYSRKVANPILQAGDSVEVEPPRRGGGRR